MKPPVQVRGPEPGTSGPATTAPQFDRRAFLKLVGGGVLVSFLVGDWAVLDAEAQRRGYPSDFNAFLRIGEDGRVTVFSGKTEMGQGIVTSLAQMAAEELGVALASVDMVLGDTLLCPWDMGTFGSMSTRYFGPALRGAAAEARAVLLELAAERLHVAKEKLGVTDGIVAVADDPAKRATFAQLAGGQRIERHLAGKPDLRAFGTFTVSGRPAHRTDGTAKVTGRAHYAGDVRLPGMLYARVLRPPAHGALPKHADVSAAERVPGVTVVQRDGLVAVLHPDPEQAARALAAIRAEFEPAPPGADTDTIFDHLVQSAPPPEEQERRGDLAAGEKASVRLFEHRYENGYGAHAPMEPHTSLASFENGALTVWASTQTPFANQQMLAEALGLEPGKVRVITPFVGGGFGGKSGGGLQSLEAAKLSRIAGRPVQVAFTRGEEFFHDALRPAAVVRIRSGLDASGGIALWDYHVYWAGTRGAELLYDMPNHLVRAYGAWNRDGGHVHRFAIGPWRAPGANMNVFARESQVDVMAAHAGADPLAFRLVHTPDARMRTVLRAAADRLGWGAFARAPGRGRGIACGVDAGSYVALCADVEVNRASGAVAVKRIACAQDMGQVVNPEGATMQMEGCITMGLGYALSEELRFRGGEVLDRNFDTYALPRFSALPRIDTLLVRNDALPPQGGGEPAIVPVGAAIANAIADATGARVFRMPMTPERVRRALASG